MIKSNEQVDKELSIMEKQYEIQEKLATYFSEKYNCKILREHIFKALFIRLTDKYNLEWQGDLWDIDIGYDEAVQLLSDFNFNILQSNLVSNEGILPEEFIMKYKVLIKSKGLIWIIHKYDKDPFPSNPHAHQLDSNIKLDLSNGKCYRIKKYVYTISKKDLLDIRRKAETVLEGELPALAI